MIFLFSLYNFLSKLFFDGCGVGFGFDMLVMFNFTIAPSFSPEFSPELLSSSEFSVIKGKTISVRNMINHSSFWWLGGLSFLNPSWVKATFLSAIFFAALLMRSSSVNSDQGHVKMWKVCKSRRLRHKNESLKLKVRCTVVLSHAGLLRYQSPSWIYPTTRAYFWLKIS